MEEIIEDTEVVNIVRFAVIDANGDILWIGECPEDEVSLQATEVGQTVRTDVPANVTDESHYYKNGAYKAYPAKPGSWSAFNYTTETWTDTRSSDRNLDFDRQDYTIEPSITVSGTTLSYAAFTATRDNGVYAESKAKAAGTVTFAGSPVLIAYSWDANTVATYASYAAMNSSPRRFLIGEFKASGVFVPASLLVDGGRVATNTVGTPQLAPLAVTSTELALAAVGKEHLQVDSVVASKIGVTDLTNIIPDSEMKDDAAWSNPGNWTRGNNPATSSFTTPGHLFYNAASLSSGYSNDTRSKKFPVEAGREYLVKYHTYSTSNHGVWGRVHWFNAQDGEITPYATVGADTAASGLREFRQVVKPPANAKYGEMRFYVNHAQTTGTVQVSSLMCRVMANGELIVDGAVKTQHLEAKSVLMSKVAITDFTNLVPNNTLETDDYWWLYSSVSIQIPPTPANATAAGNIVIPDSITATSYAVAGNAPNQLVPVESGAEYYFSADFRASGTAPYASPRFGIWWYNGKGEVMASASFTAAACTNTNYQKREWKYKIPAGARYARFAFGRSYTTSENGTLYIENPLVKRKNGGELIVEGAITAESGILADLAVTTLKIGDDQVTVPYAQFLTNSIPGTGGWIQVSSGTLTLPYKGQVLINWNGSQGYSPRERQAVGLRLRRGTTVLWERVTGGGNSGIEIDWLSMSWSFNQSAGSQTYYVDWWGGNENLVLGARTLSLLGAMK